MSEAAASAAHDTGMAGLAVRLRGTTKVYDNGTVALGPVDLDVKRGEFLSLLGPSGCGKSTALRLIAGLATQSAGTVQVAHRDDGANSIGFVFQEPTLMPWATVADNVRLPLTTGNVSSFLKVGGKFRDKNKGRNRNESTITTSGFIVFNPSRILRRSVSAARLTGASPAFRRRARSCTWASASSPVT